MVFDMTMDSLAFGSVQPDADSGDGAAKLHYIKDGEPTTDDITLLKSQGPSGQTITAMLKVVKPDEFPLIQVEATVRLYWFWGEVARLQDGARRGLTNTSDLDVAEHAAQVVLAATLLPRA